MKLTLPSHGSNEIKMVTVRIRESIMMIEYHFYEIEKSELFLCLGIHYDRNWFKIS